MKPIVKQHHSFTLHLGAVVCGLGVSLGIVPMLPGAMSRAIAQAEPLLQQTEPIAALGGGDLNSDINSNLKNSEIQRDLSRNVDKESEQDLETPPERLPVLEPINTDTNPEPVTATPQQIKVKPRIVLDLSDRQLTLYAQDQVLATYDVAIGREGWETPVGEFHVMYMALDPVWENPWTGEIINPGPDNPIGRAVIVFEMIGDDMVAFHGTPNESLIGQAVSHGCVRMRNDDILDLYNRVSYGTPVSVVP